MKRAVSEPFHSSFLSAAENAARQRQNVRCDFKKMEESTRAAELALDGHSWFISGQKYNFKPKLTEVGWFWVQRPFEAVFQSISGPLPKRGRKRKERIDESKNVQTTPPAPTASAVGPYPTVIQIVGRPDTGCLPTTIAPPDHPELSKA